MAVAASAQPATPTQATAPAAAQPAQTNTASNPLQIKIGDSSITPIAFMDLTNTFRSTNAGSSLQSNFASIPYNNVTAGHLSEDKLTAANSRIGFRVDSKVKDWNVLGYFESDFLGGFGNGNFNTQVTTNSMILRVRLFWVDVQRKKWEFLAGQSWSMMVPNRRGISAMPADLFYGLAVDTNYLNGLPWGRTPGGRVVYHASDKWTLALGAENGTQYFGGSGGAGVPVLPSRLAPVLGGELDQSAANGIATPNVRPDIIAKVAYDPGARAHFEVAGVTSAVRLFNPLTNQTNRGTGYAGAVNAGFDVARNTRLVTNNFYGRGEGRYLFGVAPDFVVRPDGSFSMLPSGSTLSGVEHTHRNTLLYAYYGVVYVGRGNVTDENGTQVGYGFPGSPNSHNRTTQQSTVGFTQTIFRDPRVGQLQAMLQYEYLFRNPWFVAPGAPKNAHENVVFFNLRYTIPGGPPAR
jgi:hypothetical protein